MKIKKIKKNINEKKKKKNVFKYKNKLITS